MPRMTDAEIDGFLDEPGHLLHLGTLDAEGAPYVVPLWYLRSGTRILITPRSGSLWRGHIHSDRRVCLTIDEPAHPYRKVMIRGEAEVVHEPGEDDAWRETYRVLCRRYWPSDAVDVYMRTTLHVQRALLGVSFEPGAATTMTWRLPVAGEDPRGIWARRYGVPDLESGDDRRR